MNISDYIAFKKTNVEAFAESIGVHHTTIYRIINGSRNAGPALRKKILAACEGLVTVNDLYTSNNLQKDQLSNLPKSDCQEKNINKN